MRKAKVKEIPVETVAALILVCVAIEDILAAGELTEDIREELEELTPTLDAFCAAEREAKSA